MVDQSRMLRDVSFAGSIVLIDGTPITEFMDDANPVDIQDTEVSNIEWSCNGRMIRTSKPSGIMISITVIPNSSSDNYLHDIWAKSFSNGGDVNLKESNKAIQCKIQLRDGGSTYLFNDGTCLSGAAGVSANGQGKMGGNTYTFAFEKIS